MHPAPQCEMADDASLFTEFRFKDNTEAQKETATRMGIAGRRHRSRAVNGFLKPEENPQPSTRAQRSGG